MGENASVDTLRKQILVFHVHSGTDEKLKGDFNLKYIALSLDAVVNGY